MKVVLNRCNGFFNLSRAAYEKLIEYGIPVRAYVQPDCDSANDGKVIFDERLTGYTVCLEGEGPYWEFWCENARTHALLVRVVEELGQAASGRRSKLEVIEIPDDIAWDIVEGEHGFERIAEKHRVW